MSTFDFSQWPNLDFSNVQKMNYMFGECTSLHTIDLSGIDPVNCSNCSYMFYKNTALTNVKLGSFKAGNNVRKSTVSSSDGVSLYRIVCIGSSPAVQILRPLTPPSLN